MLEICCSRADATTARMVMSLLTSMFFLYFAIMAYLPNSPRLFRSLRTSVSDTTS